MFSLKTGDVVKLLDRSVHLMGDVLPYIQDTIGDQSDNVLDLLLNSFNEKHSIVSEYAATQLAVNKGSKPLPCFQKSLKSLDGWLVLGNVVFCLT
jgi:hypothetical protein